MADEVGLPEAAVAEAAASPELQVMVERARVAPATGAGGRASAAAAGAPEAARTSSRGPRPSNPADSARGIIHPLLEKGALELVEAGYYRDLTSLLEAAVFRLLESDHPGDLGRKREDAPPI